MITKEHLHAEVDKLLDEDIARVYAFILHIQHHQPPQAPLLQRLKQVHIQAPPDFAAQHDQYVSGGADHAANLR